MHTAAASNNDDEIDVDLFAGGGGTSEGVKRARGRAPHIAVNHDPDAIACHTINHPETDHYISDVFEVDPLEATQGRRVGLLWLSPDCKHHSKAKGGKPRDKNIRALANVVFMWLEALPETRRPRVIGLENVEEFQKWGPLDDDGMPIKERIGEHFREFVARLESFGYVVEFKELRACDFGAPTVRKRLYMVARRDGFPIVWPEPTHAKKGTPSQVTGGKLPWRAAAEIIDWSIPCASIFLTPAEAKARGVKRPLAPATMQRIAKGVMRYVIDAAEPFIVPITHTGERQAHGLSEPVKTITCANRGELALVSPILAGCGGRAAQSPPKSVADPINTITAKADQILVVPHVTKFNTGATGSDMADPLPTVVSSSSDECNVAGAPTMGVVSAFIAPRYGERQGQTPRTHDTKDPLPTIVPTGNGAMLVSPIVVHTAHGERDSKGKKRGRGSREASEPLATTTASPDVAICIAHLNTNRNAQKPFNGADEPVHTITAEGAHINVVSAFLAQHNTGEPGQPADKPVSTIVGKGPTQGVVAAHLINLKGSDRRDQDAREPAPSICAQGGHVAEVRAFLMKYYGTAEKPADLLSPLDTVTTLPRFALVTIAGEQYEIVDIGMRMLTPRELFLAQGFSDDYVIDQRPDGTKLTKSTQIRLVGNSVCPPVAAALIGANMDRLPETLQAAA